MNREALFPTPLYYKDLPNAVELNNYLFNHIKKWAETTPSESKTNSGTGWHSPTDMNHKEEYQPLIKELFKMAEECNNDYGVAPKLGLGNMWANINPPGAYNKTHTHPNSLWSGVYYIKVPENSGKFFIEDPRPGPNTYMPRRLENLPKQLWRVVAYEAKEGRMVFFPSWLPHGVDINQNTEQGEASWRISVSFNFIQI
tara:strand:+ start:397 stop:993 length:597 start_codon:yes stop_codon:yes gene_type:complete